MYADAIASMGAQAAAKLSAQRQSLVSHIARSALAGMYVGICIVLIFTVGATVAQGSPHMVRLLMGVCFGGALTFVIFAGSELFTGSNLVLTLGVLTGKARGKDLAANWVWTWIGNLLGSVLIAVMAVRSGVLDPEPIRQFVVNIAAAKMTLTPEQLILRAVLANWIVCLAVWMAGRSKSDPAKIVLIWLCMFTFITCGFEHSVANMTGLMLGLALPHEAAAGVTWAGYGYNLALATLGNIIGGAVFVGGIYWIGSPNARRSGAEAEVSTGSATPAIAYSPDAK